MRICRCLVIRISYFKLEIQRVPVGSSGSSTGQERSEET